MCVSTPLTKKSPLNKYKKKPPLEAAGVFMCRGRKVAQERWEVEHERREVAHERWEVAHERVKSRMNVVKSRTNGGKGGSPVGSRARMAQRRGGKEEGAEERTYDGQKRRTGGTKREKGRGTGGR